MSEYECSCVCCGSTLNLMMFAHRNSEGKMVGWIFSCLKCEDTISDMKIILEPRLPETYMSDGRR